MGKKTKRRFNEVTAKIQIDRFFEACRSKHKIYAFQNESKLKYDFVKELDIPTIVTLQAKRSFFVHGSDNKLVDDGFVIEYNHFTKDMLKKIKDEILYYFRNSFYIIFPKEDLRNKDKDFFSGQIIIKNWEEKNND